MFRYIQLPKMRGVLMIAVLLRFMDSFMIYTEPFVLTGGGPATRRPSCRSPVPDAEGGRPVRPRPAAAFSLIYFLIILLLLCFIPLQLDAAKGTADKGGRP